MKYFNVVILFSVLLSLSGYYQEIDSIRVTSFSDIDTTLVLNEINKQDSFAREYNGDTLLNTSEYLVIGDSGLEVLVVDKNDLSQYPNFVEYANSYNDIILLNRKPKNLVHIYKRYKPKKSFKDYPSQVFKGELEDPNFESNPKYKMYITKITNECKQGVNFAGHYTMVTWGCGSPCQRGALVDRKTGEIFDGLETTYGIDFKKDSRLVIKNEGVLDRKTNLIEIHGAEWYELSHVLWDGKRFKDLSIK